MILKLLNVDLLRLIARATPIVRECLVDDAEDDLVRIYIEVLHDHDIYEYDFRDKETGERFHRQIDTIKFERGLTEELERYVTNKLPDVGAKA